MFASAAESRTLSLALPCNDSCSDAIPPSAKSTRRTWTTLRILASLVGPKPRVFPNNSMMQSLAQQCNSPCFNLQSRGNTDVCIHASLGNYLAVPCRRCDDVVALRQHDHLFATNLREYRRMRASMRVLMIIPPMPCRILTMQRPMQRLHPYLCGQCLRARTRIRGWALFRTEAGRAQSVVHFRRLWTGTRICRRTFCWGDHLLMTCSGEL